MWILLVSEAWCARSESLSAYVCVFMHTGTRKTHIERVKDVQKAWIGKQ